MIWDPHSAGGAGDSALSSYLKAEIGAACGGGAPVDPVLVDELTRAVEHFLERERPESGVDVAALVVMASQALAGLGEEDAARRLLLFGTGLVRVSEWEVTGGQSVWVLDLRRVIAQCSAALELALFGALNLVLEAIAELWDESGGAGVLGLRHVGSTAAGLLEQRGEDRRVAALTEEIVGRCRRKLEGLSAERAWRETPRVMTLDL